MKNIKITFWGLFLSITVVWLLATPPLNSPITYFAFRDVFIQYSGLIAISAMSLAMLLAVRPVVMESFFNGLDKMYRLHKWLGISALILAVLHWFFATGTKWMVGLGWLARPERRGEGANQTLSTLESFFRSQRGLAEGLGEWAFYGAVILIALALITRFPYRLFKKTHHWLAVAYLILAYHTIILVKTYYWGQAIGWVLAVFLAVGISSALLVLFKQIGKKHQATAIIESLEYYPELKVLEINVLASDAWQGHQAGQFVFAMSKPNEGAHPYTIASAWNPADKRIKFVIKELGDHTKTLHDNLTVGQTILLEGAYGRFNFKDNKSRQIWIGGGIGITPFIAQMNHLATQSDHKTIDFFHTTKEVSELALAKLKADAAEANINLHILIDAKDGYLTAEKIQTLVPDWKNASIWFCGPTGFGAKLKGELTKAGLNSVDFHQEIFNLR